MGSGRLVNGRLVTGRYVTGRYVTARYVTRRYVTGRYVTGCFVCTAGRRSEMDPFLWPRVTPLPVSLFLRSTTESKMELNETGRRVPLWGSTSSRLPVTWANQNNCFPHLANQEQVFPTASKKKIKILFPFENGTDTKLRRRISILFA